MITIYIFILFFFLPVGVGSSVINFPCGTWSAQRPLIFTQDQKAYTPIRDSIQMQPLHRCAPIFTLYFQTEPSITLSLYAQHLSGSESEEEALCKLCQTEKQGRYSMTILVIFLNFEKAGKNIRIARVCAKNIQSQSALHSDCAGTEMYPQLG